MLAIYGETISLANLHVYTTLIRSARKNRLAYESLRDSINAILAKYEEFYPKEIAEIKRLKLEIRFLTHGTPTTEPLDSVGTQEMLRSDPEFSEQQYNAISELLQKAYRKAAMLAHPDRGGSKELFALVNEAYKSRDLDRLIALYIEMGVSRNLFWQQSDAGMFHAASECDRYRVKTAKLQAQDVFTITRFHLFGKIEQAKSLMHRHLINEILKLSNEVTYLKAQNGNHKNEGKTSGDIYQGEDGHWQEDVKESGGTGYNDAA